MVEEPYTAISCGRCGYLTRIGTAKTFRCSRSSCDFITDRDFNGARNVLFRYLSLYCKSWYSECSIEHEGISIEA
jgi:transposase